VTVSVTVVVSHCCHSEVTVGDGGGDGLPLLPFRGDGDGVRLRLPLSGGCGLPLLPFLCDGGGLPRGLPLGDGGGCAGFPDGPGCAITASNAGGDGERQRHEAGKGELHIDELWDVVPLNREWAKVGSE